MTGAGVRLVHAADKLVGGRLMPLPMGTIFIAIIVVVGFTTAAMIPFVLIVVVATAPSPTRSTPSLPRAGAI